MRVAIFSISKTTFWYARRSFRVAPPNFPGLHPGATSACLLGRNPAASLQPKVFFQQNRALRWLEKSFLCDTDLIYSKKSSFFNETYKVFICSFLGGFCSYQVPSEKKRIVVFLNMFYIQFKVFKRKCKTICLLAARQTTHRHTLLFLHVYCLGVFRKRTLYSKNLNKKEKVVFSFLLKMNFYRLINKSKWAYSPRH